MLIRRKNGITLNTVSRARSGHGKPHGDGGYQQGKIVIVGNPNVGKSVIFNDLTGAHVTVSNYPGTTVGISRGKARIAGKEFEVKDTPGMYALLPITEEERLARAILITEKPDIVLHVVDGKNLERMLSFTMQLIEAGLPVILAINMMDEAEALGIDIDVKQIELELGVPVVATVATTGYGLDILGKRLGEKVGIPKPLKLTYGDFIESALAKIEPLLKYDYHLSKRSIGLLLLQADSDIEGLVKEKEGENYSQIQNIVNQILAGSGQPLRQTIALRRIREARRLIRLAASPAVSSGGGFADKLNRAMMNPISGMIILLMVLFVGFYLFVGVFGAGIVVGFIEDTIFGQWINPRVTELVNNLIPYQTIRDLFIGEYGVVTLGLTYGIAIILPIVGTFFIMFSVIEDSGYLPRLAMLLDRLFKVIGLNGRAVIPMVLGFGCDTMATVVTRTQETKRERVITTLLLALAIPCSAQLGVILAILSGNVGALLIWATVVMLVMLIVGYLASKIIPGDCASFYTEIPPLRWPKISNVLIKTYTRMRWYFMEVIPVFLIASVLLWLGDLIGLFDIIIKGLEPLVRSIGLPAETAQAFLFGFFRRDFGAAGLYDLHDSGVLFGVPLVVAAVTLTLFVPCVAQFVVMLRERGIKTALAIASFVFPFAFLVGFILNRVLVSMGVSL